MNKLLLSSGSVRMQTLQKSINVADNLGFSGIEIILPIHITTNELTEIKDEFNASALSVINLHSPFFSHIIPEYFIFPGKAISKMFNTIEKASAILNPSNLVIHPFPAFFFKERKISFMEKKLNILKKKISCQISIENMEKSKYPLLDPYTLINQNELKDFGKKNGFYITQDTAHCASRNLDPGEFFTNNKELINNIHLSDFRDKQELFPLGAGVINWENFFNTINRNDYKGFFVVELNREPGTEGVLKSKKLIEQFMNNSE